MIRSENPRLCLGTYFTLLLESRKQRARVRERFNGKADGLSDPEVLIGLARVTMSCFIVPDRSMLESVRVSTANVKNCSSKGGMYYPFGDTDSINAFNDEITNNYVSVLGRMDSFCDFFLRINDGTKKDERLVKSLVDMIMKDDSISGEQLFYINEDGTAVSKKKVCSQRNYCFQPFLLGVLHYVLLRPDKATIGKKTFEEWCPSRGGGQRKYEGRMGMDIGSISLSYLEKSKTEEPVIISEEDTKMNIYTEDNREENNFDDKNNEKDEHGSSHFMNFIVNGNIGKYIDHVDTIIENNVYGGK